MTREAVARSLEKLRRRRRRVYILCACGMAAGLVAMAWSASKLIPVYGAWSQEHRTESRSIGVLSGPAYVRADIYYGNEAPEDIRLEYAAGPDAWKPLYNAAVTSDPGSKIMSIAYDLPPDMGDAEYRLSLRPGSNKKIDYEIDVYPSYKYLTGNIVTETCPDGKLWLSLEAEYGHALDEKGVGVSVQLQGKKYATLAYSGWASPGGERLSVCVTDLLERIADKPDHAGTLSVSLSASYQDPDTGEIKYASLSKTISLDDPAEWPMAKVRYDPGATDEYLERHAAPKPRNGLENAGKDQETTEKGGDADAGEN